MHYSDNEAVAAPASEMPMTSTYSSASAFLVDCQIRKNHPPLGEPGRGERPDRDPFQPKQDIVLVAEALPVRRDQNQIDSHPDEAQQNDEAAGPVDEVTLLHVRFLFASIDRRNGKVEERVGR